MLNPLSNVLIKIFVRGFYRNHAGELLFFFIGIFSYCFFIQVLNETHLDPAERIIQNLLFVLTLLTSPPLLIVVFSVWIGFTIKSRRYITTELSLPANQFLFYSGTAMKKIDLFKSWIVAQFLISMPITIFALFSWIVGIISHQYLTPIVIFIFIVVLNALSSLILTAQFYKQVDSFRLSYINRITQPWPKPFWSLFIYHSINNLTLTLLLTKIFSFIIITGLSYLLADIHDQLKVGCLISLCIATGHSFLLFESSRFERSQISFIRNFPWSRTQVYFNWVLTLGVILLPEMSWLLILFKWNGLLLVLFCLSVCLLVRNLPYLTGLKMKLFLYWVFGIFTFSFAGILFNLILVMIPLALIASWIVFYKFYYRQILLTK